MRVPVVLRLVSDLPFDEVRERVRRGHNRHAPTSKVRKWIPWRVG
jgi:hypothetical protein